MDSQNEVIAELGRLLQDGDDAGAFRWLEERRDRAGSERWFVESWLRLATARPFLVSRTEDVAHTLGAWRDDDGLRLAACAALNALAELRPMDEPIAEGGPAEQAVALADEGLKASPEATVEAYLWINRANALRRFGPARDDEAVDAYERALSLEPERGWWWMDYGVCHKWRGRWEAGFECQLKARARLGDEKGVLWNMAICATGMGQGDLAAGAWRDLGFEVSLPAADGMPLVRELPDAQLRVPSRGTGHGADTGVPEHTYSFELLSVAPLSPCHGVVQSASFRDTPVDFGDIVMWDGDPVTLRTVADQPVPVFALLARIREGDEVRLPFVAREKRDDALRSWLGRLPEGLSVQIHRAPTGAGPVELTYGKLLLQREFELRRLSALIAAEKDALLLVVPRLYELLGETKKAGQEHQAWGGLERKWRTAT